MSNAGKGLNILQKFCSVHTGRFLKHDCPFFNIIHGRVKDFYHVALTPFHSSFKRQHKLNGHTHSNNLVGLAIKGLILNGMSCKTKTKQKIYAKLIKRL